MEKWVGRVALVTGSSSGIGWEVAKKLASFGMTVIACARNMEKLQELSKTCAPNKVVPIKCDLSKEEEILEMFSKISKDFGGVDVCINNAGLFLYAPLLSGSTDKWRQVMNVNVMALCICTRESVQQMLKRKVDDGFVINMCSVTGHKVLDTALLNFYTGTKHMVTALTECVSNELRDMKSSIRVAQISPGVTESNIWEVGGGLDLFKNQGEKVMKAEDIANAVVYILSQPPHVQVCEVYLKPTHSTVG